MKSEIEIEGMIKMLKRNNKLQKSSERDLAIRVLEWTLEDTEVPYAG